jgi:hypothetical protein
MDSERAISNAIDVEDGLLVLFAISEEVDLFLPAIKRDSSRAGEPMIVCLKTIS